MKKSIGAETILYPTPVLVVGTYDAEDNPAIQSKAERVSTLMTSFLSGRNERTLKAYRQDVKDFRSFMGVGDVNEAARILLGGSHEEANALILEYKASLIDRDLQAATINRRLGTIRSLVRLAQTIGMIPWALMVSKLQGRSYRDKKAIRGPAPFGYTIRSWKMYQDAEEQKAIDMILDLRSKDLSLRKICRALEAKGIVRRMGHCPGIHKSYRTYYKGN